MSSAELIMDGIVTDTTNHDTTSDNEVPAPITPNTMQRLTRIQSFEDMDQMFKCPSVPIRLDRDKSTPIDVYPWFEITVQEINSAEQTFTASVEIHLFWQDFSVPALCPRYEERGFTLRDTDRDCPVKLSEIFENKVWESRRPVVYKYLPDTSTVYMMILVTAKFVERMELQRFPLDRQFLAMEFNGWTGEDPNGQRCHWNWIMNPPDWVTNKRFRQPFAVRMLSSVTEYGLDSPWIDFACAQPLKIRLRVERLPWYYAGSIVLPNCLIVFAAFSALMIQIDDSETQFITERLAVTVTLMLTAVVFKYVVSESLPKITYFTIMDYYLLEGFLILTMLIVENTCSGLTSWPISRRESIDIWIGWICAAVWIVTHVWWCIVLFNRRFMRIGWQQMDKLDEEEVVWKKAATHKYVGRKQSTQVLHDWEAFKQANIDIGASDSETP
eukprot:151083_1